MSIDMVGHSRGAIGVLDLAKKLEKEGCPLPCNNNPKAYGPHPLCKPVRVRFVGLYDPVTMMEGYNDTYVVSPIIRRVANAKAMNFYQIIKFKNGVTSKKGELSRAGWDRPKITGLPGQVRTSHYQATHAALGGAPTFDTEDIGTWVYTGHWNAGKWVLAKGSMPKGYTNEGDVRGSIDADQWIRSNARDVGVPIAYRWDYDFRDLPEWNKKDQHVRPKDTTVD